MKKRILTIALVGAMMTMTGITAYATEVNPVGGDPFDVTPNPDTADTSVEFSIAPAYTVTIPERIELTGRYGTVYTNTGDITADSVFLEEGKKIVVTLSSASKFNLSTSASATYNLPYTASTVAFGNVDKAAGGTVAEFATSVNEQTVTVTFTTDETPQYAGNYSDPVVFGISIQNNN